MKKLRLILIVLVISSIGFTLYGCNKKVEYTEFMSNYIEICKEYTGEKITKQKIEDIIGKDVSSFTEGNEKDLNSYVYNVNDEELIISTDYETEELVFIRYAKLGEIELAYVVKEGMDIGGYKPGFTSNLKSKGLNDQMNLLNQYFKDTN